MRNVTRNVFLAGAGVVLGLSLAAGAARTGQDKSRAQEVLAQARSALGGDAQLKAIQSLSVSGTFRRTFSGLGELEGDLSIDLMLPDKFRKSETMSARPETSLTTIQIVNGEDVVFDLETSGAGMMSKRPNSDLADPKRRTAAQRAVRLEYEWTMIVLLLTPPAGFPIEFNYLGIEEISGRRADVLEAKGPDEFAARLYFEQKTHLPLMLSYQEKAGSSSRILTFSAETKEDIQKIIQDQKAKSSTSEGDVEIQLRFSDYKTTEGIFFPHKLTKTTGGKVSEERKYSKFKINPTLKPEQFKKKEQ